MLSYIISFLCSQPPMKWELLFTLLEDGKVRESLTILFTGSSVSGLLTPESWLLSTTFFSWARCEFLCQRWLVAFLPGLLLYQRSYRIGIKTRDEHRSLHLPWHCSRFSWEASALSVEGRHLVYPLSWGRSFLPNIHRLGVGVFAPPVTAYSRQL